MQQTTQQDNVTRAYPIPMRRVSKYPYVEAGETTIHTSIGDVVALVYAINDSRGGYRRKLFVGPNNRGEPGRGVLFADKWMDGTCDSALVGFYYPHAIRLTADEAEQARRDWLNQHDIEALIEHKPAQIMLHGYRYNVLNTLSRRYGV